MSASAYQEIHRRIEEFSQGRCALLAVSKLQPAAAIRALYEQGQRQFGENYVQEALGKQSELSDLPNLVWHLIGPLQSNKARVAARHFDWIHSVDRDKLPALLAAGREPAQSPLNLLIQVNIDDESSKHGCTPDQVPALADRIAEHALLRLRGLMAIPDPQREPTAAFARMAALYEQLRQQHSGVDTLSMGMSADYPEAIAAGANLVRLGTALFGARS